MVAEQFPMSQCEYFEKVDVDSDVFIDGLKYYCCIFDVEFYNLHPTNDVDSYISFSKCEPIITIDDNGHKHMDYVKPYQQNNGRVYYATYIKTTITNVDYTIIKNTYKWDKIKITNFRRYMKAYLPKPIVETILQLYVKKTQLKNVIGSEAEYLSAKENVNAIYGMMVTDPVRNVIDYNNGWMPILEGDVEKTIEKYNKSWSRFNWYLWGVFVTAYARRNLWTGILEFGDDYIYSDTDSIKCINYEKHVDYINRYNEWITKKLETTCKYYELDTELLRPKTIKGKEKPLGVWDYEGVYNIFKTLGAKRYMYYDTDLHITIAGLGKSAGAKWLKTNKGIGGAFEFFNNEMYIPSNGTGKLTHTYIDSERDGVLNDYLGCVTEYHEKSGVHLEPAPYDLRLATKFVEFLTERGVIYD